jgi:lipopolysaccharide/colanic/teichoic acid biosynthesis glycosyltransferase
MIGWISKRVASPWSRRTRWTPLLQNQREFQRTLAKERSRVDRDGTFFGFVILRLTNLTDAKRQTVELAKLLHKRLRDTDEKGHLGLGRIGLILPATNSSSSEYVLSAVLRLAGSQGLKIDGEFFVYPEQHDQSHPDRQDQSGQFHLTNRETTEGRTPVKSQSSVLMAAMYPAYPTWKRVLDIAGALVGLVFSAPFLVLCALLIKLTSRGPILFRQQRTGYLGQPFEILKLRTMVVHAEDLKAKLQERNERDGPAFKMRHDPRITKIGKFLRSTGLDELPQLVNVLRGQMSLVGPRPLPIDEANQCKGWQKRRQEIKPGLTCFWQLACIFLFVSQLLALGLAQVGMHESWFGPPAVPLRTALSEAKGLMGAWFSTELLERLDMILMMVLIANKAELGFYAAAVPAASIMIIFPNAAGIYAFNRGARHDERLSTRDAWKFLGVGLGVQFAIAIFLAVVLPLLIRTFYGEDFGPAITFAWLLLPAGIFRGLLQTCDSYLRARKKPGVGAKARFVGVPILLATSFFAEPWLGSQAIPVGLSIAQLVCFVIVAWGVLHDTREHTQMELACSA